MAGGHGYPKMPQQPSPDRRMVGSALAQQGMMASPGMPMMEEPMDDPAEALGSNALRRDGAFQTGGPGQDVSGDAALAHAVGDALSRAGNGYQTNPNRMGKMTDRARADLLRLGLSEAEAELMLMTGGF